MRRLLLAGCVAVVLLSGCGGSPQSAAPPMLPGRLAQSWATRADAIAAAAERGNDCRAQRLASSLASEVDLKLDRIPRRLRAQLVGAVQTLSGRFTCVPLEHRPKPPKGPKPPKEHGHGHGHDKGGGDGG